LEIKIEELGKDVNRRKVGTIGKRRGVKK